MSNRQFVSVGYNNVTYYGGNQSWWDNESTKISNNGCGVIAMCNLELYIANGNKVFTYQEYKDYVNKRIQEQYSLTKLPLGKYTLSTNKMENGLEESLNKMNIDTNVEWAKTYHNEHANSMIKAMLECDIPVVASYYKKEIIDDFI